MAESIVSPSLEKEEKEGWVTEELELVGSWYSVDNPRYSIPKAPHPTFLQSVAVTSNLLISERNQIIPFRRDHPDYSENYKEEDQPLLGYLKNFTVRNNDKGFVLCASVSMSGELLKDFRSGAFPKRSVGFCGMSQMSDGAIVGPYVDHLAILGVKSPAFPDVGNANKSNGTVSNNNNKEDKIWEKVFSLVGKTIKNFAKNLSPKQWAKFQETEDWTMAGIEKVKSAIALLEEAIKEMGGGETKEEEPKILEKEEATEPPGKETEKGKEDTQEVYRQLRKEMSSMKAENLIDQGRLSQDRKPQFLNACEKLGLNEAVSIFASAVSSKVPPMGNRMDGRAEDPKGEKILQTARQFGFDETKLTLQERNGKN